MTTLKTLSDVGQLVRNGSEIHYINLPNGGTIEGLNPVTLLQRYNDRELSDARRQAKRDEAEAERIQNIGDELFSLIDDGIRNYGGGRVHAFLAEAEGEVENVEVATEAAIKLVKQIRQHLNKPFGDKGIEIMRCNAIIAFRQAVAQGKIEAL